MAVEKAYALATLLEANVITPQEYEACLDALFLENLEDELLLELQCFAKGLRDTKDILTEHIYQNGYCMDYRVFGRALFGKLAEVYRRSELPIEVFAGKAFRVWSLLPEETRFSEPFLTLTHADDSLAWAGEKEIKELFEKAFAHDFGI